MGSQPMQQRTMKRKAGSHSHESHLPISNTHNDHQTLTTTSSVPLEREGMSWCFGEGSGCLVSLVKLCVSFVAIVASPLVVKAVWLFFSITIAIASLPFLILSFLITRVLQFFRHGDGYDSGVHLKLFLRAWIYTGMSSLALVLAIFYGIAKYNPSLKQVVILGTPLKNWVVIYFVIYGIYVFNWALSVFTFKFIPVIPLNRSESGLNVPENLLEIIDCLIFWLALSEVLKRVPDLKDAKILGLYTRKWIEVTIFIVIAYNIIVLCTRLIVRLLKFIGGKLDPGTDKRSRRYLFTEKMMHLRYVVYCANGIKHNIDFILISVLLVLTWELYFGSHLDEKPLAKQVFDIVSKTFISLLICSFLWLIKTCLLLSWEVRAVYNRLESKIVEGAKQLYFLGMLGRRNHDIFNLLYEFKAHSEKEIIYKWSMLLIFNIFPIGVINMDAHYKSKSDNDDKWVTKLGDKNPKRLSTRRMKIVKENLLIKKKRTPTLYGTQQAAHYFLEARETLKQDKYDFDILDKLKTCLDEHDRPHRISKAKLKQLITAREPKGDSEAEEAREPKGDSEAEEARAPNGDSETEEALETKGGSETEENDGWGYFTDQLFEHAPPNSSEAEDVSLDLIEKWLERARNNCLFLANTLASAKEGVRCLNHIISWLLIAVTFILWLLLTGFATTQVLVLIASPLLAATVIFGDSCKTLFQGIIFAYVVHPFDVGDLCFIEDTLMEVRTIGVWITTFSKVGTGEEVIYPNSELSTKKITNHKTSFNWDDVVKIDVTLIDDKIIKSLQQDFEKYFNENKEKFSSSFVVVLRSAYDTKISVSVRYNVNMKNSTYSRCHKEKQRLQSELLDNLHDLVTEKKRTKGNYGDKNSTTIETTEDHKNNLPNL